MAKGEITDLDLIPPELLAPRLSRASALVGAVAVVLGVVVGFLASSFLLGVLLTVVLAVPPVVLILLVARHHTWIDGTTVHQRFRLRSRHVDFAEAVSVEVVVRAAKVSQVLLRVSDGNASVTVALALYTVNGGRELQPMGLRSLANALSSAALVPAAAAASVLIKQLRAEARDAGLAERPLYAAVTMVKNAGREQGTVLTDREVAELSD
ncbi:hypothetical protein GCM10007304_23820 [Rhodococcoides trifolii]|uniref:Uncharacterized protein n=1 Tax=Rhodococcoides trifolii TaxID=908250 RepID=A0A917FVF2_9NOCA|nr:hypothetical protein [Rhodococcus trifolii]GGG08977.1 hypothetical protein GCM10007304_23820 [Rhodococcus trifolii]